MLAVAAPTATMTPAAAADLAASASPSAATVEAHRRLVLLNRKLATMIFEASAGRLEGDALEREVRAANSDFDTIVRLFPTLRRAKASLILRDLTGADLSLEAAGLLITRGEEDAAGKRLRGAELALRWAAVEAARSLTPSVRVGGVRLRALAGDVKRLSEQFEQGKLTDRELLDELRRIKERKHAIVRQQFPRLLGAPFISFLLDVEAWKRAADGILFATSPILGGQPDALRDLKTMKRAKERIEARVAKALGPEPSEPVGSKCLLTRNFVVRGAGTPRIGFRSFGLRVLFPKGSKIGQVTLFDAATEQRPRADALGEMLQWAEAQRDVGSPAGFVGREYVVNVSYRPGERGTSLSRELWGYAIAYDPPGTTSDCEARASEISP